MGLIEHEKGFLVHAEDRHAFIDFLRQIDEFEPFIPIGHNSLLLMIETIRGSRAKRRSPSRTVQALLPTWERIGRIVIFIL
jgi:hypothetical protein